MKWEEKTIGDLISLQRGHDLTAEDRSDGDVPVIGSAGQNGCHNVARASGPGVTIGRSGGSVGVVTFVSENYWPHNTCIYVTDFRGNDPKFVAMLLGRLDLASLNSGAAQPSLNRNFIYPLRIKVPPVQIQTRIASILTTYDELIENNRRRMALLEESARLLYREWFVHLRFPGHATARVSEGIPEGWRKVGLGAICEAVRESVSPDEVEPDTPYIGLEHMPRRSISLGEWDTAEKVTSNKFRYREGDILFGKIRPYFHKVGIAFTDGIASSDAIVMRAKEEKHAALLLMTVSSDPFVADAAQSMREGSKMPRADWKQMTCYPVLLPPDGLLQQFSESIHATTDQLKTLTFQTQKLKTARDLLLPKLMSGEIEV